MNESDSDDEGPLSRNVGGASERARGWLFCMRVLHSKRATNSMILMILFMSKLSILRKKEEFFFPSTSLWDAN